ncbi:hypothetical protein A7U43_28475 (plasmid) [Mycobacterium adipatum]|uniref:Uncharacterized protein n=1 Tax=Mycobacterium adipatum TaxID=1682113 RepID=A0A172UWH6_9MYCO|nr:hypothetical protein [Mycobacterium adipatum]ANE83451.1 hypothetical protein A7U43_28475 [Mycobacterium adipatum]
MDAANALLAKGNSFLTRLMYRGVRGELIQQPWFQSIRQQSADPFVYITFGIGVLLVLIMGMLPGLVGIVITLGIWAGLAYLYFAIGTKKAHQFIAYGIGGGGAAIAALSALLTVATLIDLAGLRLAGTAVTLLIVLVLTVLVGAALAYVGVQVHRAIKRMSGQ